MYDSNCLFATTASLEQCTALKQLDIADNSLTGQLPTDAVLVLTDLEALDLSNNLLSGQSNFVYSVAQYTSDNNVTLLLHV